MGPTRQQRISPVCLAKTTDAQGHVVLQQQGRVEQRRGRARLQLELDLANRLARSAAAQLALVERQFDASAFRRRQLPERAAHDDIEHRHEPLRQTRFRQDQSRPRIRLDVHAQRREIGLRAVDVGLPFAAVVQSETTAGRFDRLDGFGPPPALLSDAQFQPLSAQEQVGRVEVGGVKAGDAGQRLMRRQSGGHGRPERVDVRGRQQELEFDLA